MKLKSSNLQFFKPSILKYFKLLNILQLEIDFLPKSIFVKFSAITFSGFGSLLKNPFTSLKVILFKEIVFIFINFDNTLLVGSFT